MMDGMIVITAMKDLIRLSCILKEVKNNDIFKIRNWHSNNSYFVSRGIFHLGQYDLWKKTINSTIPEGVTNEGQEIKSVIT